jgi:hypothetical protein
MHRTLALALAVVYGLLTAWPAPALSLPPDAERVLSVLVETGAHAEAQEVMRTRLTANPRDADAHLALAAAQLFVAVERLGQSLHRHGLEAPRGASLPFLRLPVPVNPDPEPLTYPRMRAIVATFLDDLAQVEATLAAMPADAAPRLRLDMAAVRLDLNGDGKAGEGESLAAVFQGVLGANAWPEEAEPLSFVVVFDRADAYWLQGYCHALMGAGNILLAYDWEETFDHSFHLLFPRSGLPGQALPEAREWDALVDIIAAIHSVRWPLVEPERVRAAHAHLLEVPRLSGLSWDAILAETDDEREWIPGPHQSDGAISGLPVTPEMVEAWRRVMALGEDVLRGERLVPHWRFAQPQGITIGRMFRDPPQVLDAVYLIQGSGAAPYVETGPRISGAEWDAMRSPFGSMFPFFAIWVN